LLSGQLMACRANSNSATLLKWLPHVPDHFDLLTYCLFDLMKRRNRK
jgi:hypothetical protein